MNPPILSQSLFSGNQPYFAKQRTGCGVEDGGFHQLPQSVHGLEMVDMAGGDSQIDQVTYELLSGYLT